MTELGELRQRLLRAADDLPVDGLEEARTILRDCAAILDQHLSGSNHPDAHTARANLRDAVTELTRAAGHFLPARDDLRAYANRL